MLQNPKALLAFVPRQVTLSAATMKKSSIETLENGVADETIVVKSSKKDKSKKKKKSGSSKEVQSPLLQAIARYLKHNGFLKSLEVLKSEASITKVDNSKVHPLDLEMFCKYLESSKFNEKSDVNPPEDLGPQKDVIFEKNIVVEDLEESKNALRLESAKKKSKKSKGSDVVPETFVDQAENTPEPQVNELNKKSKDKKKKKSKSISDESGAQENMDVTRKEIDDKKKDSVCKTELHETEVKTKNVKKKKSKSESVSGDNEQGTPENTLVESLEEKASKKRKRLTSEETGSQPNDKTLTKEARLSNTNISEEDKKMSQASKENSFAEIEEHTEKKRKTENGQVDSKKSQNTSEDDNLEKRAKGGSAQPKSTKKQLNGSAEPKTINAFQRVKVDKVEFADDRLQDNSYWAKDGAEVGYGAKAQEVLGQVRGRDFRHEKTKKKRGSYRGGQIDQETHSIKFNYSDEE